MDELPEPPMKRARVDGLVSRSRMYSPYSKRMTKLARKMSRLYPAARYGRVYVERGTPDNIGRFGSTWKDASEEQRAMRRQHGYIGRGLYTGRGGFISDALGAVGRIGGNLIGMGDMGEKVGGWLGGKFEGKGLYTGRGLYNANQLITGGVSNSRPPMSFSGTGDETSGLIISQTEYIGDVYAPSSASYQNTSYPLNPGLIANFPFLSQFAQNFDEYEFVQLVFEYHSTIDASATNNSAGNTGTVIMATNYNASATPFSDKESMIQYHGGISGRMTEKLVHGVECDPKKSSGSEGKYTRTGIPVGQDLKTYDLGLFQIAFQNVPSAFFNQQVGELWVSYTVKLRKPKLFSANAGNVQQYRAVSNGGESFATIAGTEWLTATSNSLICAQYTPGNGGIGFAFPATTNGVFEFKVIIEGANLNCTGNQAVFGGNVTNWRDIMATASGASDAPESYAVSAAGSNTTIISINRVIVRAATGATNNTISCTLVGNAAATITQVYVEIMEITPFFAQSTAIQVPLFQNASGQIKQPYV